MKRICAWLALLAVTTGAVLSIGTGANTQPAYSATVLTPAQQAQKAAICAQFNANPNAPLPVSLQAMSADCPEVSV